MDRSVVQIIANKQAVNLKYYYLLSHYLFL